MTDENIRPNTPACDDGEEALKIIFHTLFEYSKLLSGRDGVWCRAIPYLHPFVGSLAPLTSLGGLAQSGWMS